MTERDAELILDAIRRHMRLPVVAAQFVRDGASVWRIEAVDPPHHYACEADDYGQAALGLAGLVGFDVMDG